MLPSVIKYNHYTVSSGLCKSCGQKGLQYFIQYKGKRKGEKFINHSAYYKVFEQVNWFRGDDEYLGVWCKDCFKRGEHKEMTKRG